MGLLVIEIAGIGQVTSLVLTKHGFKTVAEVASASVESLSVVPGFANARSLQTIKRAKELLQAADLSASKEVSDSGASKEKTIYKKPIKNKKAAKKSKNKDKKVEKIKSKRVAKELSKKAAKLKDKKAAKDKKAKKSSSKVAIKKKSSKKSKKK